MKVIQPLNKIDTIKPRETKQAATEKKEETAGDIQVHVNESKNKEKRKFLGLFKSTEKESKKDNKKSDKTNGVIPEKVETEKETKEKFSKRHKRIFALVVVLFVVVMIVVGLAGLGFAQEKMYQNKVFPGVEVWGEPVGGKTVAQVEELISKKISDYKVTLDGPDQDYTATADDLGMVFDVESIALSAYSRGRSSSIVDNYLTRARLLLLKLDISAVNNFIRSNDLALKINVGFDQERFDKYLENISANIAITPQDSKVTVKGSSLSVVPAVYGREVLKDDLRENLLNDVKVLKPSTVMIRTTEIKPNVIDQAAEETRIQTENVIARPVILTYQDQEYRPSKDTVASWISFTKQKDETNYKMIIDPAKMSNYFAYLESKVNIYPVNQKVRVENGVKYTTTQEGKDGTLLDRNLLGKQIAQTLPVQSEVKLAIPTYVGKFKTDYEQIVVADWDQYIDINISTQTMTAYTKGGNVVGSWAVTTGNRYHPTPEGTWLVMGKSAVTRMTGGTPGVDYYDLPNVHWVTWFKGGGYSIHEAYWRTVFGGSDYAWNGSHGCVNAPIDVAKFIYDWAPVGTPVIVHS